MQTNAPKTTKQANDKQLEQSNKPKQESCIKCFMILGLINIICAAGIYYGLGGHSLISFEVAYISTLLILLSSITSVKSTIKKETSPQYQAQETPDKSTQKTHNLSHFILGLRISFGLYRILAYIALIVGLVLLINYEVFAVIWYIAGIMLCVLSVILFKLKHSQA